MTAKEGLPKDATLDQRTKGFMFRAFDQYRGLTGVGHFAPDRLSSPADPEPDSIMKEMMAHAMVFDGLKYLTEHASDQDIRRLAEQAAQTLRITKVLHTYFGEAPELLERFEDLKFVQPQLSPDESPFFAVLDSHERPNRFLVVPELWMVSAAGDDANNRLEALALLVHSASYMHAYQNRHGIKGRIMASMSHAIGLPQPEDVDEYYQMIERYYVENITRAARRETKAVLMQGFQETKGPAFSLKECEELGFPKGRYIPTSEPFREIFYK